MKKSLHFCLLACAPIALIAAAPAGPIQLTSNVMVEKTAMVDGRQQTVLKAPDTVVPGDRLLFQTNYRNTGAKAADHFVVTNPVPASVAYAGESSAGAEMSVDGGKHYGELATLRVTTPDGQSRPARPEDVTNLRWTLASIAPGTQGTLKYRGMVR
jgi:uncharacterized repeat protein (TIGR01451 family)